MNTDDKELEMQERLAAKVEAFGASLAKKRQEAVNARKNSGIEDEWTEAEESYQGIDDANRNNKSSYKPASPNGSFQTARQNTVTRSSVFLNITRPYVDAASARVADMLLPNDETNWGIRPTPIPKGKFPKTPVAQAMPPQAPQGMPGMPPGPQGMPGMPPGMPEAPPQAPLVDPIVEMMDKAREASKKAKTQIEDWLIECQWHAEVRKAIEDCARLGTGILKGPVPVKRFNRVSMSDGGMLALAIQESISPATIAVDPWNFFPDPACGENIHEGAFVWEMDRMTTKKLRELKGLPGVLDFQIDKAIEKGPSGDLDDSNGFKNAAIRPQDDDRYTVWHYYGTAEREDLEAAGIDIPIEGDVSVPAIITMVNDCVIKAALNPLDSGEFPYDVMPWQRRAGTPFGMGVAKQINTPQRMLNAATRNMMDNAAFTAGPQLIVRKGAVQPADGQWALTPRKLWWVLHLRVSSNAIALLLGHHKLTVTVGVHIRVVDVSFRCNLRTFQINLRLHLCNLRVGLCANLCNLKLRWMWRLLCASLLIFARLKQLGVELARLQILAHCSFWADAKRRVE